MDFAIRENIVFSCVVAARRVARDKYTLLTEHGAKYTYRHRSPRGGGPPGRAAEEFGEWAEAAARLQEHPARRPDAVIIWSHTGRPVLALGPAEGAPEGVRIAVDPLEPVEVKAEPVEVESVKAGALDTDTAEPASEVESEPTGRARRWLADARRL